MSKTGYVDETPVIAPADPVAVPDAPVEPVPWTRKQVAESLVRRRAALAAGVGLIPVLGLDVAALVGVQLDLINKLCDLYRVPFSRQAGLNIIFTLMAGVLPVALLTVSASLLKSIPVIGSIAGSAAMAINSGAVVYALGMVMVRHFESGGTLLDIDAAQTKQYFHEQMKAAPTVIARENAAREAGRI